MNAPHEQDWLAVNQRLLGEELERLRALLRRHAEAGAVGAQAQEAQAATEPAPPSETATALDYLCLRFGLSPFERRLLLLAAAVELESGFAPLCAAAQADPRKDYASFGLALATLPEAHWSALSPEAPLRYWHLLDLGDEPSLTGARLRIDERILHFLVGIHALDARLAALVRPLASTPLAPSQRQQAEELPALWQQAAGGVPVVRLVGDDPSGARGIAAHACALAGVRALAVNAGELPTQAAERLLVARLLSRECALQPAVVVIAAGDTDDPASLHVFIEQLQCPVVLVGGGGAATAGRYRTWEVRKPAFAEAMGLWRGALDGAHAALPDRELDRLIAHFDLSAEDIAAVASRIVPSAERGATAQALWQICRVQARGALDSLASRIDARAQWQDLVLPAPQLELLQELARQVRHRVTVYQRWGFAERSSRGLGVSALFAGESGTGKTLAAEVLARELELDLYRIDLSAVVSKYIGETEKNLKRVFDAAEASGAVLLFDEADALFGKRSEVKDSHDRYANIELAYLLQRMEAYRGLAILTTNMRSLLDTAFQRRIRFVVHFPFPDAGQREAIWHRVFPSAAPCEDIRMERLARLSLAGGNIRNIAVNAAFLAADEGASLTMRHLLHAARIECAKLDKPLTGAEIGGWQ